MPSPLRVGLAVVGALAIGFAACSSFDDAESPPSSTPDGDASTNEGGSRDDAGGRANDAIADAGDDAGENLLDNGDFELGCANWSANQATLASDNTVHGGSKSCRVCAMTPGGFSVLGRASGVPVVQGATYAGTVWVRAADDAPAPTLIDIAIDVGGSSGTINESGVRTSGPPVTATWSDMSTLHKIETDAGGTLELTIGANPGGGNCFLLDDARLYRLK